MLQETKKDTHPKLDEVTIHIDKKMVKSSNPSTGSALYRLGSVDASKYDLYLEVHGQGDDDLIPNDQTPITLKNGDHLYTIQKNLNPGAVLNG